MTENVIPIKIRKIKESEKVVDEVLGLPVHKLEELSDRISRGVHLPLRAQIRPVVEFIDLSIRNPEFSLKDFSVQKNLPIYVSKTIFGNSLQFMEAEFFPCARKYVSYIVKYTDKGLQCFSSAIDEPLFSVMKKLKKEIEPFLDQR